MVRNIAITGVIPLPAVTKRILSGGGSGNAKFPCGAASRTIVPDGTPLTMCVDRKPSGIAFTAMEISFLDLSGGDVSEFVFSDPYAIHK